jgi:hypothetical protein
MAKKTSKKPPAGPAHGRAKEVCAPPLKKKPSKKR